MGAQLKCSWLMGTLPGAMGLICIGMYLYQGRSDWYLLLTGVGFFLITPLSCRRGPPIHMVSIGLAALGLTLMIAGLFIQRGS